MRKITVLFNGDKMTRRTVGFSRIVTNMQGTVPIRKCEFYGGDNTLKNENEILSIECKR